MDKYLNNRQNEILWDLLANPADNGHSYTYNLQSLVKDFPQSGLLQALLAHSDDKQNIRHAAAYFDPKILYSLVNEPYALAAVSDAQIVQVLNDSVDYNTDQYPDASLADLPDTDEQVISDVTDTVEAEQELAEPEIIAEKEISTENITIAGPEEIEALSEDDFITDTPIIDEPAELAKHIEDNLIVETEPVDHHEKETVKDIDDDIYDEIVGIEDISFESVSKAGEEESQVEAVSAVDEKQYEDVAEEAPETSPKDRGLDLNDEAEKLILGNIAATDYFVFDKAVGERKQAEPAESDPAISSETTNGELEKGSQLVEGKKEVSKYYDDKLPYTFMWWLDKTRKEHAGIYQPFKLDTSQSIKQNAADELQQQYYENIFHLNSVEELDRSTAQQTVEFDMKRKEDMIMKRFIVEEPHIKPPSSDKLDNENKAKKSAEDQDEMVTETLARIYSDQMLYHKAINTYKKLILKFPEKSRYFADQIEQLEKKIN